MSRAYNTRCYCVLGLLILLCAAGVARIGAFWTVHDHPVELAYTQLAMQMGTHPSLSNYSTAGLEMRHIVGDLKREDQGGETGYENRRVPLTFAYVAQSELPRSFDNWPSETNPFRFKPPMLPALMAYSHHQLIGPKLTAYPLLDKPTDSDGHEVGLRTIFDIQSWAVSVPYVAGLTVLLLTFLLGWQLSGPGSGLLAAAMITFHPYQSLVATRIWPESTMTAFMLLTAMILHYFLKRRSWAGCFVAGIVYALAMLTDPSALYALPAVWGWTAVAPALSDRPILRKIFNPYFGAFLIGFCVIGQCWPAYTHQALGGWMLSQTLFESRSWTLATSEFIRTGAAFFIFMPLLTGALRPRAEVRGMVSIAISMILLRWLYCPQAPWDARAWAAAMPFAALAAAPTLLTAAARWLGRKSA